MIILFRFTLHNYLIIQMISCGCMHLMSMYKPKTSECFFLFRSMQIKEYGTSIRLKGPKVHCNAKCIYKYQAQKVKMNDINLTNSNTRILSV